MFPLLCCLVALALGAPQLAHATPWHQLGNYTFADYEIEFGRVYSSGAERAWRQGVVERRLAMVRRHNARPGVTWHRGVNHLTDRTEAELQEMRGLDRSLHFAARPEAGLQPPPAVLLDDSLSPQDLPPAVDWREKNVVTPVKNQGSCGSCWTFASAETLESHMAIKHGSHMLQELSEQFILDCTPNPHECGWVQLTLPPFPSSAGWLGG
jgi:cathepsin L